MSGIHDTLLADLGGISNSNSRFKSLTDTIPQLMWTADPSGCVNYINDRCKQYSGLDSTEKFGEAWVNSLHEEDRERILAAWINSVSSGTEFKDEYRLRGRNGKYRWFKGHAMPIRNQDGSLAYWIGTATDIEEEKLLAIELKQAKLAAEEANLAKSSFLANMSHEIRTPLSAILGYSGLLKEDGLTKSEREQYAESIERQGYMLTRIIDDLLDLARIEAGRIKIECARFSLLTLGEEVMKHFGLAASQKGVSLNVHIGQDVPHVIESDPVRLRQILINLTGNALKFTNSGSVSLRFSSKSVVDGQVEIAIEVEDTGMGMTREQSLQLFKPFTQADNSYSRKHGGTGLGLAISKRLAEALGGTISITRCAPDEGCTFLITLLAVPVSSFEPGRREKARTFAANSDVDLTGLRILVVDDSRDNLILTAQILKGKGATVDVASGGIEAIDRATGQPVDFILLDIQMPGMDGYQTLNELRSRGVTCPVAALTAHAMIDETERIKAAGFVQHLTKPLNLKDLFQTIKSAT